MKLTPKHREILLQPKPIRKDATGQELLVAHRQQAVREQLLSVKDKKDALKGVRG
jgi:hypothetical protein